MGAGVRIPACRLLRARRKLPGRKIGGGWRIGRDALEQFLRGEQNPLSRRRRYNVNTEEAIRESIKRHLQIVHEDPQDIYSSERVAAISHALAFAAPGPAATVFCEVSLHERGRPGYFPSSHIWTAIGSLILQVERQEGQPTGALAVGSKLAALPLDIKCKNWRLGSDPQFASSIEVTLTTADARMNLKATGQNCLDLAAFTRAILSKSQQPVEA